MPVAGGVARGSLPGGGSGQRRGSCDHGADRPAVFGAALLWLAPRMPAWFATQVDLVNRKRVPAANAASGAGGDLSTCTRAKRQAHKIYPYLLGGLVIERVNQVIRCGARTLLTSRWQGLRLPGGLMDWVSRAVLACDSRTPSAPILCRGARESACALRQARDLQYRPGESVHQRRLS